LFLFTSFDDISLRLPPQPDLIATKRRATQGTVQLPVAQATARVAAATTAVLHAASSSRFVFCDAGGAAAAIKAQVCEAGFH
jgi:hypothetical protein